MNRQSSGPKRAATYTCQNRKCQARASILVERLDRFVGETLLAWAGELADEPVTAIAGSTDPHRRPELEQALADAELGLEAFVTSPDGFGLEPALFARGVEARKARIAELRAELDGLGTVDELVRIRATLRQVWPLVGDADKRALLAGVVDRVEVDRSVSARRGFQPLEERVRVVLTSGRVLP